MSSSPKIITKHNDIEYELIFNHSVILLGKDDPITYYIDDKERKVKLEVRVIFENDDNEPAFRTKFVIKDGILTLNHNKWYADTPMENDPLKLSYKDSSEHLMVKCNSSANHTQKRRKYEIAIWHTI